jgi:hypothetical protein
MRAAFTGVTQGKQTAQAYSVSVQSGTLTDLQLAEIWLYSDALHAQVITEPAGDDLGLDERYQAAAGVYARLGAAVSVTYSVLAHLVRDGFISLNKEVFSEPVLANTSIDFRLEGGYSAPVGSTPMPTDLTDALDLDPAWTPIHKEFEQIIQARKDDEARQARAEKCPRCRATGGVRVRGRLTAFSSPYDVYLFEQWSR